MPEIFNNARIFIGGYEFSSQYNQVSMDYSADSLDATTFGFTSKVMQGGLKTGSVRGAGFWQKDLDAAYFETLALNDAVVIMFPQDISEGSTSSGFGYGFKAMLAKYEPMKGAVGDLLPFTIEAVSRGVTVAL